MKKDKEIAKKENFMSGLMAGISMIPVVGSAFNEVLFDRRSRIKQERINSLVSELKDSVEKMEKEKLNTDFLKTDEFGDILETTFRKASDFGTSEKIKYFKNIILNQIQDQQESSTVETFLNLISSLNVKQIQLLEFYKLNRKYLDKLYKRVQAEVRRGPRTMKFTNQEVTFENADIYEIRKYVTDFQNTAIENIGIGDLHDLKYFVQDMISKSLMVDHSIIFNYHKTCELVYTTEFADRFLKFIKEYK